ncbi:uncharacterized protein PITG_11831 [Phytophthora infestans T30-4]|uniref:Uncharacterized protein n=2 Tax=Phytophthora infestans TaxID=4787 RepID=D0NHX4_PHYIT|nr:uncharacterized protein PITG_11831 [Phytophthora infestans T30-4]EEY58849.1 hypothetical protein PITG_11831 [Phytophthora infestans T30-4]KAI9990575.1 hypothetical protein PInf_018129 [Phytophthora infestans]KAI9990608.1 hypothetical protein PInf_018162 [Phytophthora infestans]|eukprot:XP_002901322.1 hypothetical protein PITG_11831 [Phytophthora infestans T30-4]
MMLAKEVLGPNSGCYTIKVTKQTQSSAEWGYSVKFDSPNAVDGVTLMEKFDQNDHALLVWTSMMVEPEGKPFFTSQGWISVKKLASLDQGNPDGESVVRMYSRLAGRNFGIQCDSDKVDIPVARKHQLMAKSRQERVQLKILEQAELQS